MEQRLWQSSNRMEVNDLEDEYGTNTREQEEHGRPHLDLDGKS